jgi:hypothetical protein
MSELTANDPKSWLQTVWGMVDAYHDELGREPPEEDWDDFCTAMAWIAEELGVDPTDPDL